MSLEDDEVNEIDTVTATTNHGRTVNITLNAERRMSNADVILELEYLISEMSKADTYLTQPDSIIH